MTLKIGLRSPKSNQLVPPSKQYIYTKLVKIRPSVQKITHGNEATLTPTQTPTPTGSAPKTICPPFSWGDINTNVDLVKDNVYTKLVSICLFVLKILSKNQILTSIKGHNSVANSRKTMIYITNVDLVNDYLYTKFGLNRSICFQDIEKRLNSDVNQGP